MIEDDSINCLKVYICECSLRTGTFKFIKQFIDVQRRFGTKRYFGDLGKTVSLIVFVYMLIT